MGLRLAEGVDLRAHPRALWRRCLGPVRRAARSRSSAPGTWCTSPGTRIRLTRQGMLVANEAMAVFIDRERDYGRVAVFRRKEAGQCFEVSVCLRPRAGRW